MQGVLKLFLAFLTRLLSTEFLFRAGAFKTLFAELLSAETCACGNILRVRMKLFCDTSRTSVQKLYEILEKRRHT